MKNIKTILEELSRELIRNNKPCKAVDFLGEQCRIRDGIVCELSNIRHVPLDEIQDGYRNKCEFSIGKNLYIPTRIQDYKHSVTNLKQE